MELTARIRAILGATPCAAATGDAATIDATCIRFKRIGVVRQLECPHDAPGRMSTPRAAYSASAKEDGMRFDTAMVQQRGAIVRLVQEQILTQGQAALELGLSERQVRRLVERVVAAGGTVSSLAYARTHAAPNRLAEPARAAVRGLVLAQPQASAQAIWETLAARGVVPLPSLRTVSRWQHAERPARARAQPRPARRFEAARPLQLVQAVFDNPVRPTSIIGNGPPALCCSVSAAGRG